MNNDIMLSARALLGLLKGATVEVRDTNDSRQKVIDADTLISNIEGMLYADRMKKYDVLIGKTLDEALPVAKTLGAVGLYVERRYVGSTATYPEPFVDFVRRNIHPDIKNFVGWYSGYRTKRGKNAPDFRLPEMNSVDRMLHVALEGDDSAVIKKIVKLVEKREDEYEY